MHSTGISFYGGKWFGSCICGWMSGAYETEDGAVGACFTHEQSQQN